MHVLADTIVFGIISAATIAVGAVGFTLQYGATNVLNLGYGAIVTSAVFVTSLVGDHTTNIALLLLTGAAWGALFSWLLNRTVIVPFVRRSTNLIGMAILTIALGLVIEFSLEAIQGPDTLTYSATPGSPVKVLSVVVSTTQITLIGVAVILMLATHLLLRHTRIGLAMRATAADPSLSRTNGISTARIRAISWAVSGALCGITGTLLGTSVGSFDASIGDNVFILIVAAAIVGGIGRPYGAMLGALVIGIMSEAAATLVSPDMNYVVAAIVIVVMLVVRPQGIFGDFTGSRELRA